MRLRKAADELQQNIEEIKKQHRLKRLRRILRFLLVGFLIGRNADQKISELTERKKLITNSLLKRFENLQHTTDKKVEEGEDLRGRLWYQRLTFDSWVVIAAFFLAVVVEYLSLPLAIGLPVSYYLSFNALTLYVDLAVVLFMIFYPTHLMRKLRETLEDLKSGGIISEEAADDVMRKTSRKIYGSREKYLPPLFAVVITIVWIYSDLSRGTFGVFDFTDITGNVVCVWSFPFTLIHDTLVTAEIFILGMLTFSTLLVIWEISRSISLMGEHVEIRIVSSGGTGGLSPIGKLMAEVVLLVMVLPTIYAVLCAAYFMITGMLHFTILAVVIMGYIFISALIPPPFLAIHKVMADRKEEALNQITDKIEKLRRQLALRDVDDASPEVIKLSSLLMLLGEVRRIHTIPLDAPSVRKVSVWMLTPLLACLSVFLEHYVGSPFGFLALVAIGVLSMVSQVVVI